MFFAGVPFLVIMKSGELISQDKIAATVASKWVDSRAGRSSFQMINIRFKNYSYIFTVTEPEYAHTNLGGHMDACLVTFREFGRRFFPKVMDNEWQDLRLCSDQVKKG